MRIIVSEITQKVIKTKIGKLNCSTVNYGPDIDTSHDEYNFYFVIKNNSNSLFELLYVSHLNAY